jgi:hypothetical protein
LTASRNHVINGGRIKEREGYDIVTQQDKEHVHWDVLTHIGRDYYIAVTSKGVVEITLGLDTLDDFGRKVAKRVKHAGFIRSNK